jgi:ATP/maltotriose-dependent transcriptional regulator MalT
MVRETTLSGRANELAVIDGALDDLEGGACRVLAISGEAGIGKSRLLAELGRRTAGRGHTLLAGRGTELEGEAPFAAMVEALDDFLGSLGPRRLQDLSERFPLLAEVFPTLGGLAEAPVGPAAERYRHHRAIRALIQELAARKPLVLMLDDVHWADAASVEAIAHLLRRPPAASVLLVLSYRVGQAPPILTGALELASRERRADGLALMTLTEEQAATLLDAGPAAERRRIFLESGGNPFYIEQLLRAHSSPGRALHPEAPGAESALQIPAAVVAAIEQELRHLPPEARRMLEGAAVTGEPFEPELAAEAAGLGPERALDLLDELVSHDLVRSEAAPRQFRFRHPIVRRAVYDSITPGRRLAAHARAAEALGRLGAPAVARAHHVALSARPGDQAAIGTLAEAAFAVAGSAPASAAQWLAVALSLLPADQGERRLALLSALADAQAAAGKLADAHQTLVEITAGLPPGSGSGWSQAVAALASVELLLGRHSGARLRLETALAEIAEPFSPQAIPLLVALAMDVSFQGDFERATQACIRALAAADGADPALEAVARAVLATMLELQGATEMEAAKRCASVAAAEFDALSDDQIAGQLDLPYYLGMGETLMERFDDAARHLGRGVSIALACGNSQFIVSTRSFLAYCLCYLGRLDEALSIAAEAVETCRLLRVPAVSAWAFATAAWAWSMVDAREAMRLGEEGIGVLGDVDDSMMRDTTHGHFGLVCANSGEYERCLEHMQLAGAPRFERFGEPGRRCMWAEALVRSAIATGQLDEARAWAARGEEFAAGLGLQVAEAATQRGRALVLLADGSPDSAAGLALQAAEAAAGHGARIESGRSRIVAGRALAAAGYRDRAVRELRATRTEMSDCGARRLEQEAARELRALGASAPAPVARRPGDAGTTQLSRREREVAVLVAAGNSNPEIAQALYLSPKTIEGHMRRIFEKLSVSSRAEVAATIARQGSKNE